MSTYLRNPLASNILLYSQAADKEFLISPSDLCIERDFSSGIVNAVVQNLLNTVDGVGIGLAAPQIGYAYRIVVMNVGSGMLPYINPVFTSETKNTTFSREGCLSSPGKTFLVERYKEGTLTFLTLDQQEKTIELSGFPAIVAQHETDHLDGVLIEEHGKLFITPKIPTIGDQ